MMEKIIYTEFGLTTEVSEYIRIGSKLKGMRNGKPFRRDGLLLMNIGEDLVRIIKSKSYDLKGNEIKQEDMIFDTDRRIAGIIINVDTILLHYNQGKLESFYSFPGGHKREFETDYECLKREMLEETGINIEDAKTKLLKEIHQTGFGPELFYIIEFNDSNLKSQDEEGADVNTELILMNLNKALQLPNLYPRIIVSLLQNYCNKYKSS